ERLSTPSGSRRWSSAIAIERSASGEAARTPGTEPSSVASVPANETANRRPVARPIMGARAAVGPAKASLVGVIAPRLAQLDEPGLGGRRGGAVRGQDPAQVDAVADLVAGIVAGVPGNLVVSRREPSLGALVQQMAADREDLDLNVDGRGREQEHREVGSR